MKNLFGDDDDARTVNDILTERHYLGPISRGFSYRDEWGLIVFGNPSSRRLPQDRWLELIRWCLNGEKNGGSRQWRAAHKWLRTNHPEVTTVISYSDPSVGHTGALYRACNWLWAPTWHRLREPPTGNGAWSEGGKREAVKDRWVFCLSGDVGREALLRVNDEGLLKRMPWASFREGRGGDYKRWVAETKGEQANGTSD